jgi:hypothetical protein
MLDQSLDTFRGIDKLHLDEIDSTTPYDKVISKGNDLNKIIDEFNDKSGIAHEKAALYPDLLKPFNTNVSATSSDSTINDSISSLNHSINRLSDIKASVDGTAIVLTVLAGCLFVLGGIMTGFCIAIGIATFGTSVPATVIFIAILFALATILTSVSITLFTFVHKIGIIVDNLKINLQKLIDLQNRDITEYGTDVIGFNDSSHATIKFIDYTDRVVNPNKSIYMDVVGIGEIEWNSNAHKTNYLRSGHATAFSKTDNLMDSNGSVKMIFYGHGNSSSGLSTTELTIHTNDEVELTLFEKYFTVKINSVQVLYVDY